jgi:eukaryotic-like serine/threonine-protein kinase
MPTYGRYEVLERLGEGATGIVYLARDLSLGRHVALKVVSTGPGRRAELVARLRREAEAVGRISHPNIVTVYDVGLAPDCLYLAMERLEGEDLRALIRRQAPAALGERARIACEIADALGTAHAKGVVHRDVKPANIFVTHSGVTKLLDFGFARLAESGTITGRGEVLGTPDYMAPEQPAGKPADHRSDIFSAGIVLYELMTFRRPFSGKTVPAVLYDILTREPDPVLTLNPEVPTRLARLIHRMLAKDPEARPQSLLEVRAEIMSIPGLLPPRSVVGR